MKTLVLSFLTDLNKSFQLTISQPKETLTEEEVQETMQKMIDANVLISSSGRLSQVKSAKYVEKLETDIIA